MNQKNSGIYLHFSPLSAAPVAKIYRKNCQKECQKEDMSERICVHSVSPVAPVRRQMNPSQETRRKIKSQRVKHTPGQQSKLFV